ncbi:MAG TPA: hypothetical protein PK402_10660 [Tepidisphaeraceae bacterium]|nr:hypothetical protein [Tepidisphaeraceae bacterium]
MTKTSAHSGEVNRVDVNRLEAPRASNPAGDAIAACSILAIVGGFLPGVFFDPSPLLSMIGVGAGLLLGLLMAYD